MQLKQKNISMEDNKQNVKKEKNRHNPKGLTIIYEDRDIIVVDKINGLLTIGSDREREKTAYFLLSDYVKKGNQKSRNRIFIVHRLDRETSGLLVFAKSEKVKFFLQEQWQNFTKKYVAVVEGILPDKEGEISSYLTENSIHRVYSVSNPTMGKFSKTGYKVIKESRGFSLLDVDLFTGRKNQIRVHFSEKGFPVAGDKVYGNKKIAVKRLALHSKTITLVHPFTKKTMTFDSETPQYFNQLVK